MLPVLLFLLPVLVLCIGSIATGETRHDESIIPLQAVWELHLYTGWSNNQTIVACAWLSSTNSSIIGKQSKPTPNRFIIHINVTDALPLESLHVWTSRRAATSSFLPSFLWLYIHLSTFLLVIMSTCYVSIPYFNENYYAHSYYVSMKSTVLDYSTGRQFLQVHSYLLL